MKRRHIFLFLTVTAATLACKKNNRETMPGNIPAKEKKWVVTTIAGDGRPVFADGPALTASFRLPLDVAIAEDGTIYIADALNHRIRKIAAGIVTTFAGNGHQDTVNGTGSAAGFAIPSRLGMDKLGNLYTLDANDGRVRQITPSADVSTYAGVIENGFQDGSSGTAKFGQSFGIVAGQDGSIYIGDSDNKRIRKITTNKEVITIAGTGTAGVVDGNASMAEFFFPEGIVIGPSGNLFVADQNRIRKITPSGIVSTFAGSDSIGYKDGQRDSASFTLIEDMVIDTKGNLFVTDDSRIRKISPQGVVSTIAGGSAGYNDGDGLSSKFNVPGGMAIDGQDNIYVADINNNRIRKISLE